MLNRRYESLHRSFRSAHHQSHRVKTVNNLSPVETAGAISYLPGNSSNRQGDGVEHEVPSVPMALTRNKKERKSDKISKWFSLGRKSHRTVSQSSSSSTDPQDNIIPIASPDIMSPITPPPSFDDLGITLPPLLPVFNGGQQSELIEHNTLLDSMELEHGDENRNQTEGNENRNQTEGNENGTRNSVAAILDAINTTSGAQSLPQSTISDENEPVSPTHRATDLDRVRAIKAQRKISAARRDHQSRQEEGGDTDEETDVQSPRTSVVDTQSLGLALCQLVHIHPGLVSCQLT